MRVYQVGGAVRDTLLGLPVKDRDWVVVGATPDLLVRQGYVPVGKDFPVFLHPTSHEEYALARTERKAGRGYKGFTVFAAPSVTLEEDLARRDLTLNAIAQSETGELIDPFGGVADLRAGILRHVGPAFSEDPVRILRLARFAARFGFSVAPETQALLCEMVTSGEVDFLVAERVWQEFAKGLMAAQPSQMIRVLRDCGALARLLPEVDRLFGVPQPPVHHPEIDTGEHVLLSLDRAAQLGANLATRWAVLMHDVGKGLTPPENWPHHHGHESVGEAAVLAVCDRFKVPSEVRDLTRLTTLFHTHIHRSHSQRPSTILDVLERTDAFRKPARFEDLLLACQADAQGRTGFHDRPYPQRDFFIHALAAAQSIDIASVVARHAGKANDIKTAIRLARLQKIKLYYADTLKLDVVQD